MRISDPVAGVEAARVDDLVRVYRLPTGPVAALRGVDVVVPAGQLTVIAGPSGSGKSTLLRHLGLQERPDAGRVVIAGIDATALPERARRRLRRVALAYVFQRPTDNLVDYLRSVGQLELAARLAGRRPPLADDVLGRLGLAGRRDWYPYRLSGGEQQRLAFAAALATSAPLVLADEPTAQLDRRSTAAVVDGLRAMLAAGASVVACSHDPVVIEAADHLVRLADGQVVEVSP